MKTTRVGGFDLCVLVNSLASGGGEKVAATLFGEYQRMGKRVILACLEKHDFYRIAGQIVYLSSQNGRDEGPFLKLFSLPLLAFRLKKLLKEYNVPVVQSHLYRANYVNVLAKLLGSPHNAEITNHGIVSWYKKRKGLIGMINLFLVKKLYARADRIVLVSRGMMADLRGVGTFNNDMRVINNPFDLERIGQLKDEEIQEAEFVFNKGKKYLICVGRFEKVKRFTDIVKVVERLVKIGVDVDVIMLGDGPERTKVNDLSRLLKVEERVHLLGQVTNPFKYISRADILLSSSEYEGFSNVIVEALAVGTPVIATDCESGPREILAPSTDLRGGLLTGAIEYAEFGLLVPVGDDETIAQAVAGLLSDRARHLYYANKGPIRAGDFSKDIIARKYLDDAKLLCAQ